MPGGEAAEMTRAIAIAQGGITGQARSMSKLSNLLLVFLALVCAGCGSQPRLQYAEMSGYLEDYSILRKDETGYVYQNPAAVWASYDKIMFEPVVIWRGGSASLDRVAESDLLRLAAALEHAVRARLARDYTLVDDTGPGVMRLELALTEARESDSVLDALITDVGDEFEPLDTAPLAAATEEFVDASKIEGELRDGDSGALLAAAVDLWIGPRQSPKGSPDSWDDVRRAFEFWADRLGRALEEARRGTSSIRPALCQVAGRLRTDRRLQEIR
jgi:hypothetical protein